MENSFPNKSEWNPTDNMFNKKMGFKGTLIDFGKAYRDWILGRGFFYRRSVVEVLKNSGKQFLVASTENTIISLRRFKGYFGSQ